MRIDIWSFNERGYNLIMLTKCLIKSLNEYGLNNNTLIVINTWKMKKKTQHKIMVVNTIKMNKPQNTISRPTSMKYYMNNIELRKWYELCIHIIINTLLLSSSKWWFQCSQYGCLICQSYDICTLLLHEFHLLSF